ncbi:hypothetical protein F441_17334 [Phytophthora nicotianae CJ01A1]|uniref:Uncharacterized protein n=1 Tax=Phytophthora nicotianae CJ01A1 TaxID=1317063 RepID=W2W6S7_PHYNI|nr:hypothetical protein F441_17334 [Phytophthora nicotianae CJ01A1]
MAQETEPVAASTVEKSTLESPSPKRRNRKKGRRTATGDDDGDEHETAAAVSPMGDVATGDLISLPSPVATVTTSTDVFAAFDVEQAMDELTLSQPAPVATETKKEDGLLKLPAFPSSGRIPRTPPSSPEHFLVHSPEKEQPRVAPMATDVHHQPTVVKTPASVEVPSASPTEQLLEVEQAVSAEQEKEATRVDEPTPWDADEDAATIEMTEEDEQILDGAVEEAWMLTSTLAEMSLTNGSVPDSELTEPEMPVEKAANVTVAEVAGEQQQLPVADDNVEVAAADDHTVSITNASTKKTSVDALVHETIEQTETPMETKPIPIKTQAATEPAPTVISQPTDPAPVKAPNAFQPIQPVTTKAKETKTQESSSRRNKRKGDSSEPNLDNTPSTTSRIFTNGHPDKPAHSSTPNIGNSKQMTAKTSIVQPQPRPAKRKGESSDVKPPPAPSTAIASEIRPKRMITRPNSVSTVNKAKTGPDAKSQPAVTARSAQDSKKDSMMHPTASSMARATAAEARKTLLRNAAARKTPTRKPMRTKVGAKSAAHAPSVPTAQDKAVLAPPAPVMVDDTDDSVRNVKRRLNASEAEAAANRLYENAKEAKARKEARRVELQENYSFAPQVNNSRRRINSGEADEPNQDRFSRLHAQAKELLERKRELQQQHEREGCTFAPSISARAKRLAQPSSGPRYENLYKHAQEMKQKREEKLLEQAKTTEEQCPFKPKIIAARSQKAPGKPKPLYDSEREKQKRLALEQKKIEAEMSQCTFKPKVSAKRLKSKAEGSADSTTEAATNANPYNRLYQGSINRTERLQKLRQERDEEEKAQAPFQPKITARSRMLKDKAKTKEPFHKRLYNKDYLKKLDAEREQRRLEEEQQFTFKPELNEPPEEIKAKVNERASPQKNIFERLYDEKDRVKEKIEMGEELRLQKEMAECTFRPQIEVDSLPSTGEPTPPVWERLLSYDKAQVIEEREKLKEQLEMQECTFKPEVKSNDAITMKTSPSHNVFDRLTGSGSSPLDPTRAAFITRRPSNSPGRQSPDIKGVSIGRIIKLTKFSLPTERKKLNRTHSISQPSSVNKPSMKRSTSFSGPKSAASSPTADSEPVIAGRDAQTENYQSWSAELDAKLRHL